MTTAPLPLVKGKEAGARSLAYRRLSEAFAFPSEENWGALGSGDWVSEISEIRGYLPWAPALEQPRVPDFDLLEGAYVSVFEVGVGRPYCPLYEGSHRAGRMKHMEDLVRFYEHFGVRTLPGDHPDHICAEFDFMHYLAFKEASLDEGDGTRDLRRAQRDFLDRHLCRWLPRVRSRLSGGREVPDVYLALTAFADEFCSADKAYLSAGGGNPHGEVRKGPD